MSQQEIDRRQQDGAAALISQNRDLQQALQCVRTRATKTTSPIISLSKLKSYMPQDNLNSKLFPCLSRASIAKPVAHMASNSSYYRKRGLLLNDSSSSSPCKQGETLSYEPTDRRARLNEKCASGKYLSICLLSSTLSDDRSSCLPKPKSISFEYSLTND